MMLDIDDITRQVRLNCDISDAQHAGLYSICGLALRLRDLYKWEHQLPPWVEKDSSEILEWIDDRENRWEKLIDSAYEDLHIDGCTYDVFDSRGVNAVLEPLGYYYGAGYAFSLKPTFLLARIEDKRRIDGHMVTFLGRELARDLLTIPAMSHNGGITLRRDAARFYLWDKMTYIKKSGRNALNFGLYHCGIANPSVGHLRLNLDHILNIQSLTYIRHEIGEREDAIFDRNIWREIIAAFPHTPAELFARAVKDLLADTGPRGSLPDIISRRDSAGMGFYVAFFDGLGKEFFPELSVAFQLFSVSGDWQFIAEALEIGRRTARKNAEILSAVFKQGQSRQDLKWAFKEIENRLLSGVLKR